jgi:hypothetical protein
MMSAFAAKLVGSTICLNATRRVSNPKKKVDEHTNLLFLLLVALAGLDAFFGFLGIYDRLLDGDEPAITLNRILGLEGVLVAGDLEGKGNGAILVEIGRIGLSGVSRCQGRQICLFSHTKFRTPAGCSFWSACLTK